MAFATQVNSKSYINVRIIKSNAMKFRGSKYVQSDLIGVFRNIKNDPKVGITSVVCGNWMPSGWSKKFRRSEAWEEFVFWSILFVTE